MDSEINEMVAWKRRQPYWSATWAKIQTSLEYYYIDLDMTLSNAMKYIIKDYDFYAT